MPCSPALALYAHSVITEPVQSAVSGRGASRMHVCAITTKERAGENRKRVCETWKGACMQTHQHPLPRATHRYLRAKAPQLLVQHAVEPLPLHTNPITVMRRSRQQCWYRGIRTSTVSRPLPPQDDLIRHY